MDKKSKPKIRKVRDESENEKQKEEDGRIDDGKG